MVGEREKERESVGVFSCRRRCWWWVAVGGGEWAEEV